MTWTHSGAGKHITVPGTSSRWRITINSAIVCKRAPRYHLPDATTDIRNRYVGAKIFPADSPPKRYRAYTNQALLYLPHAADQSITSISLLSLLQPQLRVPIRVGIVATRECHVVLLLSLPLVCLPAPRSSGVCVCDITTHTRAAGLVIDNNNRKEKNENIMYSTYVYIYIS